MSADTLCDSCQLTITWMSIRQSTIKLNTDCICLGQLAIASVKVVGTLCSGSSGSSGYAPHRVQFEH